jgi:integrase
VNGTISLNKEGNVNHTKGGKPRRFSYSPVFQEFMVDLKNCPGIQRTSHLFTDRLGLAERARKRVRQACRELGIRQLGTHGLRKTFSVEEYHRARLRGAGDRQALLETSHKLGHNRIDVTRQSYVTSDEREKRDIQYDE